MARSPMTVALGRSCRMRAARPAELSPARCDGTPFALAALASDVEAGGGSAAGDDGTGVALWLPATGAGTGASADNGAGADSGTDDGASNGSSAGAGAG